MFDFDHLYIFVCSIHC